MTPLLFGRAKDLTGGYRFGLTAMAVAMLLAVGLILLLRRQVEGRRIGLAAA